MDKALTHAVIVAEYGVILETLKKVNFNKSKAAELLKIDRKTLYNKLQRYKDLEPTIAGQNEAA